MSQVSATARPIRAPRRAPAVVPLRVLPTRVTTSGNGAFATMCVLLLTVGLIGLLLLNTALAQGSIEFGALQRESGALTDTASNLEENIDSASASGTLARSAAQLGMVRAGERGYIDLATGKVSGTASPATRLQAFSVVTSPTPVPKPRKVTPPAVASAPAATPTSTATSTTTAKPANATPTSTPAASTKPTAKTTSAPTSKATTKPPAQTPTGTTTGTTTRR